MVPAAPEETAFGPIGPHHGIENPPPVGAVWFRRRGRCRRPCVSFRRRSARHAAPGRCRGGPAVRPPARLRACAIAGFGIGEAVKAGTGRRQGEKAAGRQGGGATAPPLRRFGELRGVEAVDALPHDPHDTLRLLLDRRVHGMRFSCSGLTHHAVRGQRTARAAAMVAYGRCAAASSRLMVAGYPPGVRRRARLGKMPTVSHMHGAAGGRVPGGEMLTARPSPPGAWPLRRRRQGTPAPTVSADPPP